MIRTLFPIFFMVVALALFAQAKTTDQLLTDISEYNRIKPLQNPQFENARDVISRRISDSKNQVIGKTQDVLIRPDGTIIALKAEMKRSLRLPRTSYLEYQTWGIEALANSYRTENTKDMIEDRLPELLSDIQTAAGDGSSDALSVNKLQSAQLFAEDSRRLGKVKAVLFDSRGSKVEAIYVAMTYGRLRGQEVAIPLSDIQLQSNGNRMKAIVTDTRADALIDYAGQRF